VPNIDLVQILKWILTAAALAILVAALAYAFGSIAGYGGGAITAIQGGQQMEIGGVPGRSFVLWVLDGFADPLNVDYGGAATAGFLAILQPFAIGLGVLTMAIFAWKIVQAILR